MDEAKRALTGEADTDEEPQRVILKPDAAEERVRARSCYLSPKKMEWLEDHMKRLVGADMVWVNGRATCPRVAMAVPKGFWTLCGARLSYGKRDGGASALVDTRPGGDDVLVWWATDVLFVGFLALLLARNMLAEEAQGFFSIGLPSGL